MTTHAIHSASSSSRWTKCAAAIRMSLGIKGTTNPAAELGTAAHELGEFCLRLGFNAYDCIGREFNKHIVDELMADAVQLYVSYIRDLCKKYNVNPMLEKRVVMLSVGDDVFGTSDCIVIIGDWLFVLDYKHGYGVVEVANNSQATFYAVATLDTFDLWGTIRHVHTSIIQPRANHADGAIRSHVYTIQQMVEWQNFFRFSVAETKKKDSTFNAGEHCKYCPARANCRARLQRTIDIAYLDAPLDTLSPEEISIIYNEIPTIKTHLEAVQAKAVELARLGKPIEGYKLVKSITKAKCDKPDDFIVAAIESGVKREDLVNEKVKSMTECKKVVDKGIVNKYFVKPPASTTLVEISNSRVAVSLLAQQQVDATGIFNPVGQTQQPDATGIFKAR